MTGEHHTHTPEETRALARRFAAWLRPGDVLRLSGGLGAGKTCFVQGLAEGLGYDGNVTSPTFSLIQVYPGPTPLVHADLYRLEDAQEVLGIGLADYLEAPYVCAIEWSERSPGLWPAGAWRIELACHGADGNGRRILISKGEGT